MGKIFNKGLSEDDKKEGLFKRLKNIENAQKNLTKDESKKKLEPIRNEEQSEVLEDKLTVVDKKPKEIVLLKDKLDFIFKNFDQNFDSAGKKIDYSNLFFETGDKSALKSGGFLKEFGTLYDLLIYLLDNSMKILTSSEDQINFFKAITTFKIIISNLKTTLQIRVKNKKRKFLQNKKML